LTRRGRAALVAATTLLATGCTLTGDETPESDASPSPATSDASLDLSGLPIPRAEFCALLDQDGVAEALEGPVLDTAHYGNGDEVEIRPGYVDISHEYGCTFEGAPGREARTWVFARPVPRSEARLLVRRARQADDCAFPKPLVFGSPGVISVCEIAGPPPEEAPTARTRLEGLFGDSWVGCEVSEPLRRTAGGGPKADVVQRAVQWCTEVVTAAGSQG
jgi:hypothetical protein